MDWMDEKWCDGNDSMSGRQADFEQIDTSFFLLIYLVLQMAGNVFWFFFYDSKICFFFL